MSSDIEPVLVLGMSHVGAIRRALAESECRYISVQMLTERPDLFANKTNSINYSSAAREPRKFVFLSIRGNNHNIFGLLEHPTPMSIGDARTGCVPEDDKMRHFIPEDVIRAQFQGLLSAGVFVHFEPLVAAFAPARVFHLCPPPPSGDQAHIEKHPGVFASQLGRGVSPMPLRVKLYRIQTELYRNACRDAGIEFVDVPGGAVGGDGALKREYWNPDPTHGNAAYGRLVLDQIQTIVQGAR